MLTLQGSYPRCSACLLAHWPYPTPVGDILSLWRLKFFPGTGRHTYSHRSLTAAEAAKAPQIGQTPADYPALLHTPHIIRRKSKYAGGFRAGNRDLISKHTGLQCSHHAMIVVLFNYPIFSVKYYALKKSIRVLKLCHFKPNILSCSGASTIINKQKKFVWNAPSLQVRHNFTFTFIAC